MKAKDNITAGQNKFATIITLCITMEEDDPRQAHQTLKQIVALARSGHQDLLEIRRKAAAKGAENVLG